MLADKALEDAVILIADSNPFMRKLVRMMLASLGARTVHEVGDGVAVLEAIQSVGPDVLILDWDLQILNGSEVMKIIRSPDSFPKPNLPVIMMTEVGLMSRIAASVRLGVHEILLKPLSPKSLCDRLRSILLNQRPMIRTGDFYIPLPHRRADLQEILEQA